MEVLLSISYIVIIIALLIIATVSWQSSSIVRLLNDVVGVTVLHGFVVPMVQRHRVLMVDVQVRRVLVEEEAAGAARRQSDRALQVGVVLHVFGAEDGVAKRRLVQGNLVAEQWVREEVEVIAVCWLVVDAAVAFVSVQVDQVWIILAIVEAVGRARIALLEQLRDVGALHVDDVQKSESDGQLGECSFYSRFVLRGHANLHFHFYNLLIN